MKQDNSTLTTKFKKFWVLEVNNYICDADYNGKVLKERNYAPSFRKFWFIKKPDDLIGFTKRDEITNKELVIKLLNDNPFLSEHLEQPIKEQSTFVIPTNMKDIIASYELGDMTKESKLEFLLSIAEEIIKLKEENQALRESNTRLKERIEVLENALNRILNMDTWESYFAGGAVDTQAKEALKQVNNN